MTLDRIVEKICQHSKYPEDSVRKMIEEKVIELSGLVSREGAAYIVARELGLNLLKETRRQLKIGNLISGLRSVDLAARIVKMYGPREFEKSGKTGRVMNMILGDDSGTVRLSLWNDEIDKIEKDGIKEGDVLKISGAYVKPDDRELVELRLGRGHMEKTSQVVDIPDSVKIEQRFESISRKPISGFQEGEYSEARACVVQVFRKNPFFEVCPQCGTRAREKEGRWCCDEHGAADPKHAMVVSGIIDDGTGNIRAVFFMEIARSRSDNLAVFDQLKAMGVDYVMRGRVKANSFTERMEFVVNDIEDVDVKRECEMLLAP
jgi:hypothetical protein